MSQSNAPIFVFGSNLAGRHGKGAALFAKQFKGAKQGHGFGLQGYSYAIPTCSLPRRPLDLDQIQKYVTAFLKFAEEHQELTFELTPIGCGLAGYKPTDIAPMFKDAPKNVLKPNVFKKVLNEP